MKKQLSITMISLSWMAWLIAVFSFPAPHIKDNAGHETAVNDLSFSQTMQLNGSAEVPEIFDYKVAWSFISSAVYSWEFKHFTKISDQVFSFSKKSTPLFDVKITFIHFYYTW